LQQTGFPVSLSGFDYMKEAIRLILTQKQATNVRSVNDLYEILAAEMCVSTSAAEHAVRHAIDTAWLLADPDTLDKLFGETVQSERAAPSNAAFLFRAADCIGLDQKRGILL
jgi:two-component system response regulator (stage 0 sporulation protein A)